MGAWSCVAAELRTALLQCAMLVQTFVHVNVNSPKKINLNLKTLGGKSVHIC